MTFIILAFLSRVSAFRHSCAQVSQHFMSRSLKLRNGAYLDWLLLFPWPSAVTTSLCIRCFRDFTYRKFVIQVDLFLLSLHIVIRETPTRSWTNGPDMNLFQRLRLDRDIAYRKIEILVAFVSFLLDIAIHETPTQPIINGLDSFSIQWLRLNRDITYRDFDTLVVKCFRHFKVPIPDTPWRKSTVQITS